MKEKRIKTKGITLLEVMIVLAIIALVAGLAAPRLMGVFGRAKSQSAEIEMTSIKVALQLYYIDVGRYPSEREGLSALLVEPEGVERWLGPYLEGDEAISDPWERPYNYRSPGTTSPFDILTYGRDGKPGGSSEDSDISL